MSSFGGSASALATGAFSSPNPSPFSSSPFGAQPVKAASNPFATAPSTTAASQSNPFSQTPSTNAPSLKNPFQANGTTQNSAPSVFGAKNAAGTFGSASAAQIDRAASPFGMPSIQGRPNGSVTTATPKSFPAPAPKPQTGTKPQFGGHLAPGKRSGPASDADEHSGSDASASSKRTKRAKQPLGGNTSDSNIRVNGIKEAIRGVTKGMARTSSDGKGLGKGAKGPTGNGFGHDGSGKKIHFGQPTNGLPPGGRLNPPLAPTPRNPTPAALKANGRESANMNDPFAKKIMDRLARDGVRPPTWPSDPGNPSNKNVMMTYREEYKDYRDRARTSLVRAGFIDDPEDRKRLEDALDFKGICEDMCPEFEKVTRITEFDVKQAEKDPDNSWPDTSRMVKKLARSAAGQEAPLPMDVRSVSALRRTLDYLIDDLLQTDGNLPVVHGFLWDRTRAIRRDFAFFSTMTPEEMRDQVYCLETIARFHVSSLHLLSQADFKPEDFSEQQEVEQLGKTLISLMYAYNDCNAQGIKCESEAEFRAYQLVFRANHSDVLEIVQREWDPKLWRESDDIRTAVSLVEALQNTQDFHGPLKGGPSFAAASAYNTYFRIVEDPSVSFTMACFAEIHFGQLRRSILSAVKKAYSRPKQIAKDITAEVLNSYMRFDTVQEAIRFAEYHGLDFVPDDDDPDDVGKSYVVLEYGTGLEYQRLHHSFSATLVENKRSSHTLPQVIHQTVFEAVVSPATREAAKKAEADDSLFVPQSSYTQQTKKQPPSVFAHPPAPAPPKNSGVSSTVATQGSNLNTFTSTPRPTVAPSLPGFPPKQSAARPLSSEATGTSTSLYNAAQSEMKKALSDPMPALGSGLAQPVPKSTFGQASSTPATGNKFGQPAPSATQQPTPAPPVPSFSFKPAEAPKAPTTTPTPALLGQANKAPPTFFNSLAPTISTTGAAVSPAIKVTPPTPGLPTPLATAAVSNPTAASSLGQPPSLSPKFPATQAPPSQTTTTPTPSTVFSPPPVPASQTAPPVQTQSAARRAPTKEDRWAQFVKWYVTGDDGLLEQFRTFVVEEAVRKVYEQHVREIEEKKRKEEDDRSWAEARKFRTYNLGVKYFYRWREISRQNRASALRRSGRDQLRAYQEAKRVERLRQQKMAARQQRRLAEEGAAVDNVAGLKGLIRKRSSSMRETEEALLASGVLSGVADERAAASRIVWRGPSSPGRMGSPGRMSPPARKAGLPGFMHKIKAGFGESVSKMRPGGGSSSGGGGAKTQALREEFSSSGLRRSLARSGSRSSLPPSSEGSAVSRVSGRWRLRAMGLITMPDGSVLPDHLARSVMQDGRRYPELGSLGLEPARRASDVGGLRPATMDGTGAFAPGEARRAGSHRSRASVSSSSFGADAAQKRKRTEEEEEGEAGAGGEGGEPQQGGKRILLDTEKTIREMRRLREEMEEGTGWFRDQNERLQTGLSRSGTPM